MDSYLDTLSERAVTITLGGRNLSIPRARLGLHIRLDRLAVAFEQAPGSVEMAEAIRDYFDLLGVDISQAHPVEILRAFIELRALNSWQMTLAFMKNPSSERTFEPYDYEARNWAWVVHKLASRYGWTRDYIFNLWPEEATCYLQEILISEVHEAEERYRLSELAYTFDKASKTSRYIPYQKPSWMYSNELPKPVRVLKSMLPFGVKDPEGKEITYH